MSGDFLSRLQWRFATKKFDSAKKVSEENFGKILEAIRFAPSSNGLQPFRVVVISSDSTKKALFPVSNRQAQVLDCSYLLVFCADLDIRTRIDWYRGHLVRRDPAIDITTLKSRLSGFAGRKEEQGVEAWAGRQTYIALGFGLAACAELGIDSCPMEGFQPDEVADVLKLPGTLKPLAYLAIGYRREGPAREKFRFPEDEIFMKA